MLGGIGDELVAHENGRFGLQLLCLTLEACRELDAARLAERILDDGGNVVETLNEPLLLDDVGQSWRAVDRDNALPSAGERAYVRQVRGIDSPVHTMPLIEVEDLSRQLISDRSHAG